MPARDVCKFQALVLKAAVRVEMDRAALQVGMDRAVLQVGMGMA